MQTFWQDLRHGARALVGAPGFTALAIAALALGIGANTAVFSAVNAVLLEPLPFADPGRLVMVFDVQPEVPQAPASFPIYVDWRDENRVFVGLGGWTAQGKVLTGVGDPARLRTGVLTDTLLPTLGVPPLVGRWFTKEEDQPNGPKAAILSYATWQQRFGGDPAIVGRSITLDAEPHTVVGIMPAGFDFPSRSDIWVTLQRAFDENQRGSHFLRVVARMRPGVSFEQAKGEMEALGTRLTERTGHGHGVTIAPLDEIMIGSSSRPLLILLGAVSFVLLIACVNVANLLLARAVSRQRELAIRTALGAARGRLVRQFLTESVLLGVTGGALGIALAWWLVRVFVSLAPPSYPRLSDIGLDPTVLAFTLAVSVATGVMFGLVPALVAARTDPNAALREGSGKTSAASGARRVTRLLVTVEIALALVLVVGAGLMAKSLTRLEHEQTGLRTDHLLTFRLDLTSARYQEGANVRAFVHDLMARLRGITGVESAGAIHLLPLQSWGWNGVPTIEGHPGYPEGQEPLAEYRVVTPDYFRTMGIPLLRGRGFTDQDTETSTPVLLVNEAAAKRFFPDEDPIGRRMRGGFAREFAEIVGIVADVRQASLDQASRAEVYFPHDQASWAGMSVAVRTARDPLALVPAVRSQVADLDPDLPVTAVSTMEQVVADSARQPRLSSVLIALFAALAALLAVVGIYGVMSYSVTERTREIGIRVAVGAGSGSVLGLVLREALALAVAGLVVGLGAAFGLTRLLASQLYEVSATDPLVLVAAAAAVLAVSVAASLVPAWRALRVDPLIALRAE